MLKVTLLGTGGTMPLKNRWLSSCLLSFNGHSVLIDCGEGTQIAMKEAGQRFKSVDVICITHFHADHLSGLPGFLLTMSNEGRSDPLTIFGPRGIAGYVRSLCVIAPNLTFPVRFVENAPGVEVRLEQMVIRGFPLVHSVRCIGFCLELQRVGRFDVEKARHNQVPLRLWAPLQKNTTIEQDGVIYTSDMVLGEPRKGLKVTYCTDTRPTDSILSYAKDADLFICEGMFGDDEKLPRAKEAGHMLFSEAAALAAGAHARRLWLTHYSPSLTEPEAFLQNATAIFPQTEAGFDGKTTELFFEEESTP